MNGYSFHLFTHHTKTAFEPGDAAFVWLRSNRSTGKAVVLQTPDALPLDSVFAGRYKVKYDCTGQTAHVRPERLLPVFTESQLILVTAATEDYRRLARSQVNRNDVVLELGCSYGMCTNILAEHAAAVIGIDNSEEAVAEARRRCPHVRFEVADVLNEPAAVLEIVSSSSSNITAAAATGDITDRSITNSNGSACIDNGNSLGPCNVVFADIGGNRQLEALLRLLPWVVQQLKPRLLVVKSEELAEATVQQLQVQQQQQQQSLPTQAQQQQQQQQSLPTQAQGQQEHPSARPQQHHCCMHAKQLHQEQVQHEQQQQQQLPQQLVHTQLQQLSLGSCCGSNSSSIGQETHATKMGTLGAQLDTLLLQQQQEHLQQRRRDNTPLSAATAPTTTATTAAAAASLHTSGEILNFEAWWDQLEVQCGLNPFLHAGRAEPWLVAARAKGFVKNPLRYPQRFTTDGVRICRPYNYDRCFKIDSGCVFDHVHCHHCGVAGHRAIDCPVNA